MSAPDPRAPSPAARLDPEAVERFAECIRAGGVVLFPADTVYGLACDPCNADAVRRLYELKGRPPAQPAAVMFFALAPALAALPELGPRTRAALERLLPGPLTVLLANPADRFPLACRPGDALADELAPAGEVAPGGAVKPGPDALSGGGALPGGDALSGGEATLGLRVPSLPPAIAALGAVAAPVLQSSANLSGGAEARRLQDVPRAIRDGADLALDGGELPGVASTVLDLRDYERDGRWEVVRRGPLGPDELRRRLA